MYYVYSEKEKEKNYEVSKKTVQGKLDSQAFKVKFCMHPILWPDKEIKLAFIMNLGQLNHTLN